MPNIDLRFVVLLVGGMGLLMSAILFFLRRSIPPSIEGLREWAAAPVIILASVVLLATRGLAPDFVSILGGNVLLIVGCLLFHVGTQRFFGVATKQRLRNWLLFLVLATPAISWCSVIAPDYTVRLRLMAVLMLAGAGIAFFADRPIAGWLIGAVVQFEFALLFGLLGLLGDNLRIVAERTRRTPLVIEKERVNFGPPPES